ncbi:MAG: AAA family ATPase [Methyloprofundus sp.]|nr:AAA family ATPase [Methyloprofundus sp.]
MHYVSSLKVKNFKSIKNADFSLEAYTPIVGYNNAGKSNIIFSLKWLLQKEKLGEEAFNNSAEPIEVEGVINGVTNEIIENLPANQQAQINPFIQNEELKIKRVQVCPNASAPQQQLLVWHPIEEDWKSNPTGIDNALKKLFPEAIEIAAMMDAAEDVSKFKTSTTIGKLIAEVLAPIEENHSTAIKAALEELKKKFDADSLERAAEFIDFDRQATDKLQAIFPGIELKLHVPTPEIKDIFKAGTVKIFEHGNSRDITAFGHGTQRSVQMALLRQLAEVKLSEGSTNTTTLLLIDEPELYLHPQAIEQVRSSLKLLSENGYQVVFSTHSPQMIPAEDVKNTLLIRKTEEGGTVARQTIKSAVERVETDAVSQYQLLFSLEYANQILFSEGVLLTEGKTEKRLLPKIFEKKYGYTLGQKQLALVDQGGVQNTVKAQKVLDVMNIPCKAIVDLDFAFQGAISQGLIDKADQSIVFCKSLFPQNPDVALDSNTGLPTKQGTVKPSEAFEWLAQHNDAQPEIQKLHELLKQNNIWLWKKGAIEPHLGISAKTEEAWANFIQTLETNGISQIADADFHAMLDWINE